MFSKWGLSACRLVFGREEIVGWLYTSRESCSLGLLLDLGIGKDPGAALDIDNRERLDAALLGRALRTYELKDFAAIRLLNRDRRESRLATSPNHYAARRLQRFVRPPSAIVQTAFCSYNPLLL